MPDFTNVAGWQVQQLPNLQSGAGSSGTVVGPNEPVMNNLIAENFDVALLGGAATHAQGTLFASKLLVSEPVITTKGAIHVTATGTTTHAYLCLVDPNGNIVAQTADFVGTWAATALYPSWTTALTLKPGYYWGGVLITGSVAPSLIGITTGAGANDNLVAATGRFVTMGTGLAALPASPVTMSSNVLVNSAYVPWIGIL